MHINFYDDLDNQPKSREDVRIKRIGLFVQEDRRRVTFGVELTPFLERPCIEVQITNRVGQQAGSLNVIETMDRSFSLNIFLRDDAVTDPYELVAEIYYATPDTDRVNIDNRKIVFETDPPGEKIFLFND